MNTEFYQTYKKELLNTAMHHSKGFLFTNSEPLEFWLIEDSDSYVMHAIVNDFFVVNLWL